MRRIAIVLHINTRSAQHHERFFAKPRLSATVTDHPKYCSYLPFHPLALGKGRQISKACEAKRSRNCVALC